MTVAPVQVDEYKHPVTELIISFMWNVIGPSTNIAAFTCVWMSLTIFEIQSMHLIHTIISEDITWIG
jgi:hypothetical protein